MLRYSLICQKHELFDHFIRRSSLCDLNRYRDSLIVQADLRLIQVKIDAAPLPPFFFQFHRQFMHGEKIVLKWLVFLAQLPCSIFQQIRNIVVNKPGCRADHAFINLMIHHRALGRQLHIYRKRQSIFIWIQTADIIGQCLWENRDHLVEQVHAGSSFQRFLIQRTVFLYIMRNICYMHTQHIIAIRQYIQRNSIVKILRIRPVYRKYMFAAQIFSALDIFLPHTLPFHSLSFCIGSAWKGFSHIIRSGYGFDVASRLPRTTDDL